MHRHRTAPRRSAPRPPRRGAPFVCAAGFGPSAVESVEGRRNVDARVVNVFQTLAPGLNGTRVPAFTTTGDTIDPSYAPNLIAEGVVAHAAIVNNGDGSDSLKLGLKWQRIAKTDPVPVPIFPVPIFQIDTKSSATAPRRDHLRSVLRLACKDHSAARST